MAVKKVTTLVQGQTVELTYNEATGYYEAVCTAGSDSSFPEDGGYFPASMSVEDTAGNKASVDSSHSSYGNNLRLFVFEQNKPQITILSPTSGAYITNTTKPEIRFEIIDNKVQTNGYSGINKDSVVLTVGGVAVDGSKISFTETEGGYIGTYTPAESLGNGECVITVNGADNDGNNADTVRSTVNIDNQAPSNELYTPVEGHETNNSKITITGKASDTSLPVTVRLTLNGDELQGVEIDSDGYYSCEAELTRQGENVITSQAIDDAGNASEPIVRTIIFSTTAPVFTEVGIIYEGAQVSADNKVPAGGLYTIRCKVTTS